MTYYILDKKHRPKEVTLSEWAEWTKNRDVRRVAVTEINSNIAVSTVFLIINHGSDDHPLWFESMVFGGPLDGECERYKTWEEAEAGHKIMVRRVRSGMLKVIKGGKAA